MKYLTMILLAAVFAMPAMAQDAAEGSEKLPLERKKPAEAKKPEMTDAGKKLLADFKIVYSKYYATLLKRIKDGQEYDSNDVWDEAVKDAKNAKYKDRTEFFTAVKNMKKKDRLFKKTTSDLINKYAKDHATAVKKINADE
ncbi:MAG: hypothetical protein ACYTDT_09640 [Planctomycetota bacterium]|jgi:hypothetical protein